MKFRSRNLSGDIQTYIKNRPCGVGPAKPYPSTGGPWTLKSLKCSRALCISESISTRIGYDGMVLWDRVEKI